MAFYKQSQFTKIKTQETGFGDDADIVLFTFYHFWRCARVNYQKFLICHNKIYSVERNSERRERERKREGQRETFTIRQIQN